MVQELDPLDHTYSLIRSQAGKKGRDVHKNRDSIELSPSVDCHPPQHRISARITSQKTDTKKGSTEVHTNQGHHFPHVPRTLSYESSALRTDLHHCPALALCARRPAKQQPEDLLIVLCAPRVLETIETKPNRLGWARLLGEQVLLFTPNFIGNTTGGVCGR